MMITDFIKMLLARIRYSNFYWVTDPPDAKGASLLADNCLWLEDMAKQCMSDPSVMPMYPFLLMARADPNCLKYIQELCAGTKGLISYNPIAYYFYHIPLELNLDSDLNDKLGFLAQTYLLKNLLDWIPLATDPDDSGYIPQVPLTESTLIIAKQETYCVAMRTFEEFEVIYSDSDLFACCEEASNLKPKYLREPIPKP